MFVCPNESMKLKGGGLRTWGKNAMEASKVAEYARALYEAHGNKAETEAAQKAKQHEGAGETKEAATWRAIRGAIREIRGAHQG
jgi:hypothetical protein